MQQVKSRSIFTKKNNRLTIHIRFCLFFNLETSVFALFILNNNKRKKQTSKPCICDTSTLHHASVGDVNSHWKVCMTQIKNAAKQNTCPPTSGQNNRDPITLHERYNALCLFENLESSDRHLPVKFFNISCCGTTYAVGWGHFPPSLTK